MLKDLNEHLLHVAIACEKEKVICKSCRVKCARDDFDGRNRLPEFITQVKSDDVQIFKTAHSEMQT